MFLYCYDFVLYSLHPEILVLEMDKMDVSITKTSLDTTIHRASISGRREYNTKS